ncbi:MAG: hypothetical protein Q8S13_13725, partial [Dehalococcoidia bacterium]|nr:hypothetical protein [Dehalococcoidia bacterium]
YTTGTVDISVGSTSLVGTSSLWNTANSYGQNNARTTCKITIAGGNDIYRVTTVTSDTAITLETRYVPTTAADDAAYIYFEDEYALEADFDDIVDARTFSPERKVRLIGPRDFYRIYNRNSRLGTPKHATLIELGAGTTAALRRRVVFGPAPDQVYTIPYRYYTTYLAVSATGTGAVNLSANTGEPIIPLRFRQALVRKALELWARDRKDDARAELYRGESDAILAKARAQVGDASDRPRLSPAVAAYWRQARRPYTGTSTGRYDVNDRFDHLEDIVH